MVDFYKDNPERLRKTGKSLKSGRINIKEGIVMSTFTVERLVTGTESSFTSEALASDVNMKEALLAYLKGIHTGHPTWIIDNSTNTRMNSFDIENALMIILDGAHTR